MTIDLKTLTFLFLLGFAGWYCWLAMAVKEGAVQAAKRACEKADVLMLDQSVYLSGVGLERDPEGRLRIRRTFSFDFTATGERRYRGWVTLLGQRLKSVAFQPHDI